MIISSIYPPSILITGNIQKRTQYGLMSDLSGSGILNTMVNPGDILNATDTDNNGTMDQTDLIEAITFASLYGFQSHKTRSVFILTSEPAFD
ncbi:unnamed protein product [Onchocerca flexuosa]|uniref:EF-hand domain-containing protein n=1 Tax=Onchocerca flexuosa TaxID=387005 RepID=A0A183HW97_9BILA|nr:unnamed protein product [Onchocerca flexuosa]